MSGKLSGTGHIRLKRRPILRVERFDGAFERKYHRSSFVTFQGAGTRKPDGTGYHALIRNNGIGFRLNPGEYLITYPSEQQEEKASQGQKASVGRQECLACGTLCWITASLFEGGDDRWDCPSCGTWGTIAHFRGSARPEPSQDER